MATINDLPVKLLLTIFNHLPFTDLCRSRRVCKLFLDVIDKYIRIEELIIQDNPDINFEPDEYYAAFWKSNGKLVDKNKVIKLELLYNDHYYGFFRIGGINLPEEFDDRGERDEYKLYKTSLIEMKPLIDLKKIMFVQGCDDYNYGVTTDLFEQLKKFEKLEELFINMGLGFNQTISHPNIKVLTITEFCARKCIAEIDCPKLERLDFEEIGRMVFFTHPKSIKRLSALNFFENEFQLEQLSKLERLDTKSLQFYAPGVCRYLPKLKEIHIGVRDYGDCGDDTDGEIELKETKENLKNVFKRKKAPKIYVGDVELTSIEKFNELYEAAKNEDEAAKKKKM